jgi:hypothetical protein
LAALRQNYTDFRAPGRVVFHNLISQNESPKLADCVAKFKNEVVAKFRGASVEADTWGSNASQRAYEGCQQKIGLIM